MMESHFSHSMKKNKSTNRKLIWVYPPNGWKSTSNKTFVYGWSDPDAQLFVNDKKIKIFPNGNFAQTIKLPKKKNTVRLVQILNGKKKITERKINVNPVGATFTVARNKNNRAGARPARTINNIVIDPGHGDKEHGTHSPKGIPEKVFNLQVAKLFVETCHGMSLPRCKIYLTRNTDKFVSLKDRVDFAKKKKCNLFISIHHNALPDGEDPLKHRGVGIYYTNDFVKPFAQSLLQNISKAAGLKKYGIFKRNLYVTKPDFYRGVLIECGFLIHPIEADCVTRKNIQEKIVRGIVKGSSLHTSQPL